MPWFFIENEIDTASFNIEGENARHISKSLRMKKGEELTLISPGGIQYDCAVREVSGDIVGVNILHSKMCENEPDAEVTLYQALPKGDKMELIIQKCVELGIKRIVPFISARCVSRPDKKSLAKKIIRWQKIAKEAAAQSRRGIIPEIAQPVSFNEAVKNSKVNEKNIIFYELGGDSLKNIIGKHPKTIGYFVGSEGGFEEKEIETALNNGIETATLGKRILRAETAPIAALSIIMYELGEMDKISINGKEFNNDRNYLRNEN